MNARARRTLFDLTQDGLGIGQKLQRIYPDCSPRTVNLPNSTDMLYASR